MDVCLYSCDPTIKINYRRLHHRAGRAAGTNQYYQQVLVSNRHGAGPRQRHGAGQDGPHMHHPAGPGRGAGGGGGGGRGPLSARLGGDLEQPHPQLAARAEAARAAVRGRHAAAVRPTRAAGWVANMSGAQ